MYLGTAEKTVVDYQHGYGLFLLPFVMLMIALFITFFKLRTPSELEKTTTKESKISKLFWLYSFFTFVTTVGFINFAIVGYHLKMNEIASDTNTFSLCYCHDCRCNIWHNCRKNV